MCMLSQSCLTLCESMDYRLPGSSVHGIFSGKNTWLGCHFLLQGNTPDPGTEPASPVSPEFAGRFFTVASPA